MYTLGINSVYHDCSATLVRNGEVIAAVEDERFTHVKHGKRPLPFTTWQLPFHAIDYCLKEAGIRLSDVDHFAYSYDPRLLMGDITGKETIELPLEPSRHAAPVTGQSPWDPLFLSSIVNAPRQLASGVPHHLAARFKGIDSQEIKKRWHFVEHHLAHEASAFLAAPFDECAVLTMDGRGERATTSFGRFTNGTYERLRQINLPHSLGLVYERLTTYLGFLHSSDEYKVMALASYGQPTYLGFFESMIELTSDGQYRVREQPFEALGPARERSGPLEQRHFDIARSLQLMLERAVLHMAQWLHEETGLSDLAMAGGVALNCVMNARVLEQGPFTRIWVQPAAGDSGTSLGAALWIDREVRGASSTRWHMNHAYLGPSFPDEEIETFLKWSKLRYRKLVDVAAETAQILAAGKVIGWFQGRMEFGPRALGARSILASPIPEDMQARLNEIKDREDFRPVAPAVMEERAAQWFRETKPGSLVAPFMLFVFDVLEGREGQIPAARHVDGTARVQTVRADQHPLYYRLLAEFERLTGVPVLINTSFNTRGEPIVCTPRDAVESFWTSPLDALVIGSFVLEKG